MGVHHKHLRSIRGATCPRAGAGAVQDRFEFVLEEPSTRSSFYSQHWYFPPQCVCVERRKTLLCARVG